MIPQVLKNFNLFVDGRGYVGQAEEVSPPKLTVKIENFRGGGMDTPFPIDLGTEPLEASFSMVAMDANVLSLWGLVEGPETPFVFRGAIQRQGEPAQPVVINMTGRVKEEDPNNWKAGEKAVTKFMVACTYYKLAVNGTTLIEIDIENMKRIINGTDQMASIRNALGI